MKKRRVVKRKTSKARSCILLTLLALSIYFTVNSVQEVTQIFKSKTSISEAIKQQEELLQRKEELIEKKKNLENPEYLLRYARGKYLVTKDDGEQVFKLPDDGEEE